MKKNYSVWAWMKTDYKRGKWEKVTMKEIVEKFFSIENVDDLEGLLDEVEDMREWAEDQKTMLEQDGEIRIFANPGNYVTIDYGSIEDGTELLDDLIKELESHAEWIEDLRKDEE